MSVSILTGLQANSQLHIGNYFGGIMPILQRQETLAPGDRLMMMVADLHSYTMPIDHGVFYSQVIENLRWYFVAGLDTNKAEVTLFRQSRVPAHTELAWHLNCFSYFGEVSRMTQFKDKTHSQEEKGEGVSVGLFTYPILMAADILLYDMKYVLVGDDQRQHLELTRDIAIRVNNRFEKLFPDGVFTVPLDWSSQLAFAGQEEGLRVRSLSNPNKKMSKSVADPKGTIMLDDNPDDAVKKIMSATTDNLEHIDWDWVSQPGITNLLQLGYLVDGSSKAEMIARWRGQSRYGELKKYVADKTHSFLMDIQAKASKHSDSQLEAIVQKGEEKAIDMSTPALNRMRKALGLIK